MNYEKYEREKNFAILPMKGNRRNDNEKTNGKKWSPKRPKWVTKIN